MTAFFYVILFLFMLLSGLLCFVILIQESKSLGLGSALGGDSQDSLFGTSTALVLKKFTGYLAGIFFVTCFILSLWTSAIGRSNDSMNVRVEEIAEED